MGYLLGLDIGTSGTKSLICDETGKVLATAMSEHTLLSPQPGWFEQDPSEWWSAVCDATKQVVAKADIPVDEIKGIGLSGQMHGSVFIGDGPAESAQALRPALLWNDQRTVAECEEIETKAGGREALIGMVANPALTGFTAPKILWLRNNEPEIYEKTKHILLPKDYIRYRMTGELASEVSDASGTLLLDVVNRQWHEGLLSKLGIDRALLPEVHESHVITGKLTSFAAAEMGLVEGIAVVGGGGDQAAGAVGNGIVDSGIVSATLGTSGVVFAHADAPQLDPQGRVHTMCSAVEDKWCVFGCMLSAGGSFQWFRNNLAEKEQTDAVDMGVDPYQLLVEQAIEAPLGAEGLLFLPYLTGERCPYPDPHARGAWVGLTARSTKGMMIRSLLEGVTFGMADALNIMREMGVSVSTTRLSGGGAKSPFWRQMQADIYNCDVATINSDEGPAYGVAILAGVGTGVWKSVPEACAAIISETERLSPNTEATDAYAKIYAEYQALYPVLKPVFPKLAGLG